MVPLGSMLTFIYKHPEQVNVDYEMPVWASQIACGMSLSIQLNFTLKISWIPQPNFQNRYKFQFFIVDCFLYLL